MLNVAFLFVMLSVVIVGMLSVVIVGMLNVIMLSAMVQIVQWPVL
jgi:hypothetical protein